MKSTVGFHLYAGLAMIACEFIFPGKINRLRLLICHQFNGGIFFIGGDRMPKKPARPCREPGCVLKTEARDGYCDQHRAAQRKEYDQQRRFDPERAVYQSRRWRNLVEIKRKADPICERCKAKGILNQTEIVHHKVPIAQGGAPYDLLNTESVCRKCHAEEEEHKAFARRRPLDPYKKTDRPTKGEIVVRE